MLICSECGAVFEDHETARISERLGDLPCDVVSYEVCPICKGTPVEAVQCITCGNWVEAEETTEHICKECRTKILLKMREFWTQFSDAEQTYIYENFNF